MTMKERVSYYYTTLGKHCPESMLLAANDVYGLGLTEREVELFYGFRGGMGCGGTCGALSGAIAALSRKYAGAPNFKDIAPGFVKAFAEALGCGAVDCTTLAARYKTEAKRCSDTVLLAADALEAYIAKLDGKSDPAPEGCTLTPEQIKAVKALGFLQHKGTDRFNGRIITRNGRVTAEELQAVTDAAGKYGDGHVMMTTRLTMEVSGIAYGDIEAFRAEVGKAGLETGGTGSKVRPVVSCKGTTCQYGLYDTYALSEEIHYRFFQGYRGVSLPHKFKIAVGGCPNNCVKPDLNDLGIIGACVPGYDMAQCKGCRKCQIEQACPVHAAKLTDGKLVIDQTACNDCGRCVGKCPFHCNDESTYGWKIYVGGRWGKRVAQGRMLHKVFTDKAEVLDTVEKAILLFREQGQPGERFADTIARLGFDAVEAQLMGGDLLARKADILGKDVTGGATC